LDQHFSASLYQISDESVRCQDELDIIFGASILDVLDPVEIYVGKEDNFYRYEKYKNEKIEKTGDHIEMNAKTNQDPGMIKIRKSAPKKKKKWNKSCE
jgi:hypothetical protein